MKNKFYHPFVIWFAVWIFICLVMLLITLQINNMYRQSNLAKEKLLSYQHPSGTFSQQFGFSGETPHSPQIFPENRQFLKQESGSAALSPLLFGEDEGPGWRNFFGGKPELQSFLDHMWTRRSLLEDWQRAAHAGYVYTILSYLMFVVGFGAICLITAIYQNHFRRAQDEQFKGEIEARNLRIQMLEINRNALDLKMKLLEQNQARARAAAQEAQDNVRNLEEKLQTESDRNEELQVELDKAQLQENKALAKLRSLNRDRQKIAAEKSDILSRLEEAEKLAQASLYLQKITKAKGKLRLNAFWLASFYKNLSFSPRAMQNLTEVQDAPDIFPSLPDGLAKINKLSVEALLSGGNLPPKTLAKFATQELEHFQGPLWEYRFSADGRVFFGISKSRTWNIDTILLKRRLSDKKEKYDRFLAETLGKENQDLQPEITS
jgi:hypothetical protein